MIINQFCHEARRWVVRGMLPGTLTLAAFLSGVNTPAEAAYHPEMKVVLKGKAKTLLREAVSAFKGLPDIARQAIVANSLGLFFGEKEAVKWSSYSGEPYTSSDAVFVATDGSVRRWRQTKASIPPVQWDAAAKKVRDIGADAVFPSVAKEVTEQIYKTAEVIVYSMPPVLRDSWLAEEAGLLFSTSGAKAYLEGTESLTSAIGREARCKKLDKTLNLRFIDADGKEQDYFNVLKEHDKQWGQRRVVLYLCIQYTSRKEILKIFTNEIAALKKAKIDYDDGKSGDSAPKANNTAGIEPSPQKASEPTPPQETSTAMGGTQKPEQNADSAPIKSIDIPTSAPRIAPPSANDSPLVSILKQMPADAREAWICEALGICFTAEGGKALDDQRKVKEGSLYIGSDGKTHDFWASQRKATATWEHLSKIAGSVQDKKYACAALSELVTQMLLHNIKYHMEILPDLMRDFWLAETGGLYYISDGSRSAYPGRLYPLYMGNGFEVFYKMEDREARFRDFKGEEHVQNDRRPYMAKCEQSWKILKLCACMLGTDKAVAVFPERLDILRKNNPESAKFPFLPPPSQIEQFSKDPATSQPAAAAGRVDPNAIKQAVECLKKMQPEAQDAWLGEAMGLCYMKNGSRVLNEKGWVNKGASFIDRNGKECDFWEIEIKNDNMWVAISRYIKQFNERMAVLDEFSEVTQALALAAAKKRLLNMPQLLRDAWLCEASGLCYMRDSDASPYHTELHEFRTPNGNSLRSRAAKDEALFTDTKGEQHSMKDRAPYWKTSPGSWDTAAVCLKYCKLPKLLEAFKDEMAILRKNYERATNRKAP